MGGYSVEAKSRYELRELAKTIRKLLGLGETVYFPVLEVLELLPCLDEEAHFEVVKNEELPTGIHALTDINSKTIFIREDVYEGAFNKMGRDRMTIAHELSHFIMLIICGYSVARSFSEEEIPPYKDPEWQAKCLAGELLMPAEIIAGKTPDEVSKMCGVSLDAAKYQLNKL